MSIELLLVNDIKKSVKPDDGCDYTAVIIARQNAAASARCRGPYSPDPTPQKVIDTSLIDEQMPKIRIGQRINYGVSIMRAVFQLSDLGLNPDEISDLLGMPVRGVSVILRCDTKFKRKAQQYALANKDYSVRDVLVELRKVL